MEATRPISNNKGYMVAREASTEVSVELQGTKRVLKVIKIASTAATKLLAATTTATRSNAADGAAITDINYGHICSYTSLVDCRLIVGL
jgi:hypothetical protein